MNVWSIIQLLACIAIAVRLLTFRRGVSRHRPFLAWLAWLYVVGRVDLAIKIATGQLAPTAPAEAIISLIVAAIVILHRGNLAHVGRSVAQLVAWLRRRRGLP